MSEKEFSFNGRKYISLRHASQISGYAKDYIGQLCRADKIHCERNGRDWFVDKKDFLEYKQYRIKAFKEKNGNGKKILFQSINEKDKLIASPVFFKQIAEPVARGIICGLVIVAFVLGYGICAAGISKFEKKLVDTIGNAGEFIIFISEKTAVKTVGMAEKKNSDNGTEENLETIAKNILASKFEKRNLQNISAGDIPNDIKNAAAKIFSNLEKIADRKIFALGEINFSKKEIFAHIENFKKEFFRSWRDTKKSNILVNAIYSDHGVAALGQSFSNRIKTSISNAGKGIKQGYVMFPSNIRDITKEFLGIKDPQIPQIEFVKKNVDLQITENDITQLKLELEKTKKNGLTAQLPIVQKTIIEKQIEKIFSGLTMEQLDEKLNQLNNKLMAQVFDVKNELARRADGNFAAISHAQKIDHLTNTVIETPMISSPTITGTLTGASASFSGNITSSRNISAATLSVTGVTALNGVAYTWPSVDGTTNYVLSTDGAGTLSWIENGSGAGVVGSGTSGQFPYYAANGTTLSATSSLFISSIGNLGIGTTSPYAKLSVAGQIVGAYFTATTSATSTFAGGIQTNLLNITSNTATSTFANGIDLANGCFSVNGVCVTGGGGSGTINSGTTNRLSYYSGATTLDSANFLSVDTTNSRLGIGTSSPYAMLSVSGQTVAQYFTATSTTATSTLPQLLVTDITATRGNFTTITGGTWNGSAITDAYISSASFWNNKWDLASSTIAVPYGGTGSTTLTGLLKGNGTGAIQTAIAGTDYLANTTGDWTGTFDSQEGTYYLNANNLTNFGNPFYTYFSGTTTDALAEGSNNKYWSNTLWDNRMTATSTLPSVTTLANLATVGTITNGTWNAGALTSSGALTINGTGNSYIAGNLGIGTTSPYAKLSVAGQIVGAYFTATTSATSTFAGGIQTNLLNITSNTATSTFANGIDLANGCFSVNGVCVTGGGGGWDSIDDISLTKGYFIVGNDSGLAHATSSLFVSSTGNLGAGTTSPYAKLSLHAGATDIYNPTLFSVASSTANYATSTLFTILANGRVGIGTTTPSEKLAVLGSIKTIADSPVLVGNLTDAYLSGSGWLYFRDHYIYQTGRLADRFNIVDVANPGNPVLIGSLTDALIDGAEGVEVFGQYAYVTSIYADSLTVIDISNPNSPIIVGSVQDSVQLNGAESIFVSGQYAFVTAYYGKRLTAVNISDPVRPFVVGSYNSESFLNGAIFMQIQGKYAYVTAALSNAFSIIDISDPYNMQSVSATTSSSYLYGASGLGVKGKYAYVVSQLGDTLAVFDISNPASITLVKKLTLGLSAPMVFQIVGDYIYVTCYTSRAIATIDISNPVDPVVVNTVQDATYLNGVDDIMVVGQYAYVSLNTGNGLSIYKLPGVSTQTIAAGSILGDALSIGGDAIVVGTGFFNNGLNVGVNGIISQGGAYLYASTTDVSSSALTVVQGNTGDIVNFFDGSTEVFTILSSGNLGIGTTSPYAKLSVAGQIVGAYFTATTSATSTFAGGIQTNLLNITSNTASSTFANGIDLANGCFSVNGVCVTGGGGSGTINSGTTNRLSYYSGATTLDSANFLSVDTTNSRLGIGTSSPYAMLSVSNSASTAINTPLFTIASTTAGVSTSTLMTVLANGNVGIGTSSPPSAYAFTVGGDSYTSVAQFYGGASGNANIINLVRSNSISASWGLGLPNGRLTFTDNSSNIPVLALYYGNSGAGNIGQAILGGDMGANTLNGSSGIMRAGNAGTTGTDTSGGSFYIASGKGNGAGTLSNIYFQTPNLLESGTTQQSYTTKMTILGGGNLGIGTTSPYAKLSIHANNGDTSQYLFSVASSTQTATTTIFSILNNGIFDYGRTATNTITQSINSWNIATSSSASPILSIDGLNGRLGIWKSNPSYTLDVNGDINVLYGKVFRINGYTMMNYISDTQTKLQVGSTNTIDLSLYAGAADRLYIKNDTGNVGIGTSSPFAMLSIHGTSSPTTALPYLFAVASSTASYATSTHFVITNTGKVGIGTTSPGSLLSLGDTTNYINFSNTATSTFAYGINIDSGCFSVNGACVTGGGGGSGTINSGTTNRLSYYSGATTLDSANFLSVDTTNSRLGVGTSSPYAMLSVSGQTVAQYFTATSSTATSTLPQLLATDITATRGNFTTITGGTWNGSAIGDAYISSANAWNNKWDLASSTIAVPYGGTGSTTLTGLLKGNGTGVIQTAIAGTDYLASATGDWTGTFDGQEGTYYLNANNLTNFGNPFYTYFSGTTTDALAEGSINKYWSNTLWDNRMTSTTTLPRITTLANLATIGTITTGTWNAGALTSSGALTINGTGNSYIAGNLGIGTTSPYAKLSVAGQIVGAYFTATTSATSTFAGGIQTNLLNITSNTATSTFANGIDLANGCFSVNGTCVTGGGGGWDSIDDISLTKGYFIVGNDSGLAQATSSLFVSSTGRLGIGTTTPNSLLHISGAIPKFTLSDTGAGENLKHWFLQSNAGSFRIATTSNSLTDAIFAALTINSNGYIGIGTSTPQVSVHLGAASTTLIQNYRDSMFVGGELEVAGNAYLGPMAFGDDSGAVSWIDMGITSVSATGTINSYSAMLDGTSVLTVYGESSGYEGLLQNQKVGIGTTTPYGVLSVNASSTLPALVVNATSSSAITGPIVLFSAGNIEKIRITKDGYLGIGTSTPYNLLTLYASGSTAAISPQIVFSASSTVADLGNFLNNWSIGTDIADGGKFKIASSSVLGTNDRFVIDGKGNIGIGTTSPYAKFSLHAGATDIYNPTLFSVASSTATYSTSTLFTILANGRLGIGTTTPSEKLSVGGLMYIGGTGTSTIENNLYVMGTLQAAVSYTGDLIFGNDFRFTEAPADEIPQALILKNQKGEDILTIDEDGNLNIAGVIKTAGTSTGETAVSEGLAWILNQFKSIRVEIWDGVVKAKEFIAEKVTAKKVVTDGLEMKDSVTGETYCVRITNGEWEKFKGTCEDSSQSSVVNNQIENDQIPNEETEMPAAEEAPVQPAEEVPFAPVDESETIEEPEAEMPLEEITEPMSEEIQVILEKTQN